MHSVDADALIGYFVDLLNRVDDRNLVIEAADYDQDGPRIQIDLYGQTLLLTIAETKHE